MLRLTFLTLLVALLLAACAADDGEGTRGTSARAPVEQRLEEIGTAIDYWDRSSTIEEAHRAAEMARNLITGVGTFGGGDLDGDGEVRGEVDEGLLPSEDPDASGLAARLPVDCVGRDVLGGTWEDPAQRWAILGQAIDEWAPTNNTFPSLPSHPQRIVGWATLTLGTDDLDAAREYAGHARLHLDVSRQAVADC